MKIEVNDDVLTINGKRVKFEQKIDEIEEFDGFCVVLLNFCHSNIYALDESGVIVWNIADITKMELPDIFTTIWKKNSRILGMFSYGGMKYEIDVYDKKIVSSLFTR